MGAIETYLQLLHQHCHPLFQPSDRGSGGPSRNSFGFDQEGKLALWSAFDDQGVMFTPTVTLKPLYRWYMCDLIVPRRTTSLSTLAWGLGTGAPQNPTCQAVNVTRAI